MKREHIYTDSDSCRFGSHVTNMIPYVLASRKKFFLFNNCIYILLGNFGVETTGLTVLDIID